MSELTEKILRLEKKALTERLKATIEAAAENENKELPIPIERIASLQSSERPILDAEVHAQVTAGVATIKYAPMWKKWGFKSGNSVLLFTGPSGTGKTTTARWIAKHLRKSLISVTMGDIGGGNPGDTERNLSRIFVAGESEKAIIFFDECDSLFWDRSKAGEDSMWMIGVINALLILIEKYSEIVILASNFSHILDKALQRRITFEVKFTEPTYESRKKLWVAKWPKWPLALPINEIANLANENLTGDDIEHAIEEEARFALVEGKKPSIANLKRIAKRISEAKTTSAS